MIFSVFDYPSRTYSYYEVAASTPPTAWLRRPIDIANGKPDGVFLSTEVLAVRLPPNARLLQTGGLDARGVVAVSSTSIGSVDPAGGTGGAASGNGWLALVAGIIIGAFFGSSGNKPVRS